MGILQTDKSILILYHRKLSTEKILMFVLLLITSLGKKSHISCTELQGQLCWFISPNVVSGHKDNLSDLVM